MFRKEVKYDPPVVSLAIWLITAVDNLDLKAK